MDMRTGDLYPSPEAAIRAGVPADQIAEVEAVVVRVSSGPFKGRVYERKGPNNLRRRKDLEGGAL